MSEIPYIAIDEHISDLKITDDNHFTGTGQLVVPFTMIDISNEQHFSSLPANGHAFTSWLPLFDDRYYIFVCYADLIVDKEKTNPTLINLYGQGQTLTKPGPFEFYYSSLRKPFNTSKIHMTLTDTPYTYPSRQARTGKIPGVNLIDLADQDNLISYEDTPGQYLDDITTDEIIRLNAAESNGVEGL